MLKIDSSGTRADGLRVVYGPRHLPTTNPHSADAARMISIQTPESFDAVYILPALQEDDDWEDLVTQADIVDS